MQKCALSIANRECKEGAKDCASEHTVQKHKEASTQYRASKIPTLSCAQIQTDLGRVLQAGFCLFTVRISPVYIYSKAELLYSLYCVRLSIGSHGLICLDAWLPPVETSGFGKEISVAPVGLFWIL